MKNILSRETEGKGGIRKSNEKLNKRRRKKATTKFDYVVGRGFNINFPVSSHDMLKSLSTCRVLDVNICGAITNLCMPITKSDTETGRKKGHQENL